MHEIKVDFMTDAVVHELSPKDGPIGMAGVSKYANIAVRHSHDYPDYENRLYHAGMFEPGPRPRNEAPTGIAVHKQLDTARERIDRRLQQAMKYLHRKNLRPTGVQALQTMAEKLDSPMLATQIALLTAVMSADKESKEPSLWAKEHDDVIPDEIFERAIELTMLNTETDVMYSKNMFGPFLEKHLGEIYQYVILLYNVSYLINDIEELVNAHDRIRATAAEVGNNYTDTYRLMSTDMEKLKQDYEEKLNAAKTEIEQRHESEKQALRRRIAELEKQIKPNDARIKKLEAALRKSETALTESRARITSYDEALTKKDELISNLADRIPVTNHDRTLPETGILFLGGRPTLTNALRTDYPDWRYVYGHDKHCKDITSPKIIFLSPYDLDHAVSYRVRHAVRPDVPIVRIVSTNLESAKYEMSLKYQAIMTSMKEAET